MSYQRILTVQDISCLGQCSLTAALPILSACGFETCILPSALLSTHTGGFSGYTFRDLTDDIPRIRQHWQKEGIRFDAVYTGYLAGARQIDEVLDLIGALLAPGGMVAVDPAMADHGRLYAGFDEAFAAAMKKLCAAADIILPNITEACFLTGVPYRETYDPAYIDRILKKLTEIGAKTVILTGVSYHPSTTGVAVSEKGRRFYYAHKRIDRICHGTGDIYASAFIGAYLNGKPAPEAAKIAAEYTVRCIENTLDVPVHWYGVKFEPALGDLIRAVR